MIQVLSKHTLCHMRTVKAQILAHARGLYTPMNNTLHVTSFLLQFLFEDRMDGWII